MKIRRFALAMPMIAALALAGSIAAAEAFPVCIEFAPGGLGAPRINLTLSAVPSGAFYNLVGEARFEQSVSPPEGLIVYSVSGTAILDGDSFWISLTGAGFNTANTVYKGLFAIRLKADAAQNTLTYSKQSLDAATTQVVTGTPALAACP